MQTQLAESIKYTPVGQEADRILRSCVHCGFCLATCPTYQLLGDELDSPRGRIYQIKAVLEGGEATRSTQIHLDRCLTCLSCETTCPSGVQYGRLLEIGRDLVDQQVTRPISERLARFAIRELVSRREVFRLVLRVGRGLRPLLPRWLKSKVPMVRRSASVSVMPHARCVILLKNCVQDALCPAIDQATARVLNRLQVRTVVAADSGCCGALRAHLSDAEGAQAAARRNIDAWWPLLKSGAEAIVMTASGCGSQVKSYGRLLANDTHYRDRAVQVSAKAVDLSEWLSAQPVDWRANRADSDTIRVAFQSPCTLQHGQQLRGDIENTLVALGAELTPVADGHLCCGSAGSYSLLQPALAGSLKDAKLVALMEGSPSVILSANVGCLSHLQSGAAIPVHHWIEWVDQRLGGAVRDSDAL